MATCLPLPLPPPGRPARPPSASAALLLTSLTGCSQLASAFNGLQPGCRRDALAERVVDRDGDAVRLAIHLRRLGVADDRRRRQPRGASGRLGSRPKRTQEWGPDNEKTFGFAVNVYDHRVDEKAVLTQKRRVYLSMVNITSQVSRSTVGAQPDHLAVPVLGRPLPLVPTDTSAPTAGCS
ncbi:MAG: hypothetical protein U0Q04_09410 [Microbacterium sp.]